MQLAPRLVTWPWTYSVDVTPYIIYPYKHTHSRFSYIHTCMYGFPKPRPQVALWREMGECEELMLFSRTDVLTVFWRALYQISKDGWFWKLSVWFSDFAESELACHPYKYAHNSLSSICIYIHVYIYIYVYGSKTTATGRSLAWNGRERRIDVVF